MPTRSRFLVGATILLLIVGGATTVSAVVPQAIEAPAPAKPATADEYRRTVEEMKPPKRSRPLVVVLGDNRGTEAIDFLVPYGVLKRSGVADVYAIAMQSGPLKLRPALTINPELTAAELDRRFPTGADYVVVPAMFDHDTPEVISWIRAQAAGGATIVAICSGAEIVANAGLLKGRKATTHWASVRKIIKTEPTMRWVPHRRYVADRGVVSTTGVSAAIPVSIALVEAIAGAKRARELAEDLGVTDWGRSHDSGAYEIGSDAATLISNSAAKWKHEDLGLPVSNGVDDIALALTADSWSRTYRSRAFTVAGAPVVTTRHGLQLVVDRHDRRGIERVLAPVDGKLPAQALDRTLEAISTNYGKATARLVGIQLEYEEPGR